MAIGGGERMRARVEVEEDMVEMDKVEVGKVEVGKVEMDKGGVGKVGMEDEGVSDFISGMAVWMRVTAERMAPSSWPGKEELSG